MLEQIREPNKGEEIAVLNTNYGAIKLRLFEEATQNCRKF